MDRTHENTALSFRAHMFFSDAVFAIVITSARPRAKAPPSKRAGFTEEAMRHDLFELLPKFLGFVYSFSSSGCCGSNITASFGSSSIGISD
jgi:hypothetical protein